MPELIEFYHPKFTEQVKGSASGTTGAGSEAASDYILEEQDANADRGRNIFHPPPVEFKFDRAFKTRKVADKKRAAVSGRKDDEAEGGAFLHASVEESTVAGVLQGTEWDTVSDTTDDTHLYLDKFSAFIQMLELLKNNHDCIIYSVDVRKLPNLPRCKKHLLKAEGNPRCIAVVAIESSGQLFHILEVDTSDEAKALSTQLLRLNSPEQWSIQLIEDIEKKLLRKSLRWPVDVFKRECGKGGFQGISHPQTVIPNKGVLDAGALGQWAMRFHHWMTYYNSGAR